MLGHIYFVAGYGHGHSFPSWLREIMRQLSLLDDADTFIKEAMIVEAIGFESMFYCCTIKRGDVEKLT